MSDQDIHSYFHCRKCVIGGQTERLEIGLTRTGMLVACRKHGKVEHFTPDKLSEQLARGPQCECCPEGMHRS
jgi:hypothetical protein